MMPLSKTALICQKGDRGDYDRLIMPAKDLHHDAIKNALEKAGWIITGEPLTIEYEEVRVFADLAAEKTFIAQRDAQKIVVEVKSFLGRSSMRELETALGQYLIYRGFLALTDPGQTVYLAIGSQIYNSFFQQLAIQTILQQNNIFLIVVNIQSEVIVEWIS